MSRRAIASVVAAVCLTTGLVAIPERATANDTATRWEYFSESSGCDGSYTRPPFASRVGSLPDTETVLGPFGTYFGRTIGDIRSSLVTWTVPYSGGRQIKVHRDALPAFREVSENLMVQAGLGRIYSVNSVGAFNPRTVGGEYQISRHALGTAIDINPAQNPYRRNGPLITDMPTWYVEAWKAAGFCWGGDWRGEKDAMHFSWIGPGTGFGTDAGPTAPKTKKRAFAGPNRTHSTVMAPVLDRYTLTIGAATAEGGPAVVGVRSHPAGAVLDVASGYGAFGACSVRRWFLEDGSLAGDDHLLMMDIDGDSRQDIVTLREDSGSTEIQTAAYAEDFGQVISFDREFGTVVAAAGADFDGDHISDLWIATDDGSLTIYAGPTFDAELSSRELPSGAPQAISAADRDGGDLPELFALYATGLEVLRLGSGWSVEQVLNMETSSVEATSAIDYDGDGRADFLTLDARGRLQARLGNSPTGAAVGSWFMHPDPACNDPIPLAFAGSFYDDDGNTHVEGIEWIAEQGITLGCNPPFNDAFCPEENLTRAQAAAFVDRALDLPPTANDFFGDDNGSTLEESINRLAAAGITRGCNPPDNDEFCPARRLTRGEFATFMVRALALETATADYFRDDAAHTHEAAINALASSGITRGCNPPVNDRFCPDRPLTRAETATFFTRALR